MVCSLMWLASGTLFTASSQADNVQSRSVQFLCSTCTSHYRRKIVNVCFFFISVVCLQCFDAVGWAAGRASGL